MPTTIRTVLGLWVIALLLVVLLPLLGKPADLGDQRIRGSIHLTLLCWGCAAFLLLSVKPSDWTSRTPLLALTRCFWTLALVTYLTHVAFAFHYYHAWSHSDAFRRTDDITGFGAGIYVSYFFSLVWLADALAWWLMPGWYAQRSPWVDRILHAFMAFIIFNGSVVYATGPVRWLSLLLFVFLAGCFLFRWLCQQSRTSSSPSLVSERSLQ
jgi:hypothetical protein